VRQKNLVLILARDLADSLASAVFVVDQEGTLDYFNERCGEMLGKTFGEVGEMKMEEWTVAFNPTDLRGHPLAPEDLPLVTALREKKPAHRSLKVRSASGDIRDIAITALPLFARRDEFVGAMAVFWELHAVPEKEA